MGTVLEGHCPEEHGDTTQMHGVGGNLGGIGILGRTSAMQTRLHPQAVLGVYVPLALSMQQVSYGLRHLLEVCKYDGVDSICFRACVL